MIVQQFIKNQQRRWLLKHWESPYHKCDQLPSATARRVIVKNHSESCHDQIQLGQQSLTKPHGYYFVSDGCMLTVALASMLCELGEQRSVTEMIDIIRQLQALIQQQPCDSKKLGRLVLFKTISDQPARMSCVQVVIDAFNQLLLPQEPKLEAQMTMVNRALEQRHHLNRFYRFWANYQIQWQCYRYLQQNPRFKRIGLYNANCWQVPTKTLIMKLLKTNHQVFVAQIELNKRVLLHEIINTKDPQLKSCGGLKITRLCEATHLVDLQSIDVLVIPVTSFDAQNHTWSYASDYYQSMVIKFTKPKVGLAYRCQRVSRTTLLKNNGGLKLDHIFSA